MAVHKIGSDVIGIHARGTAITPVSQLQPQVLAAVHRCSGRIWLMTDEPAIRLAVEKDSRVLCLPRPDRHCTQGMRLAIADLLILAQTRIKYYSPRSTFSWVAIALSSLPLAVLPRRQVGHGLQELIVHN